MDSGKDFKTPVEDPNKVSPWLACRLVLQPWNENPD